MKPKVFDEQKELEKEIKILEGNIAGLETEKQKLEDKLTNPEVYGNPDKLQEINSLYKEVEVSLAGYNSKWDALISQLTES